ncbi:RagB/SusD family nutrient uptake outer membrane protein [Marinilabiliaceae bacterium JC017]|nr:RagB/SusD family nutrient uptake outer membrane protein [Marinilabiliaceae bacterium JC017]
MDKNNIFFMLTVLMGLILGSCDDYLSEASGDLIIPQTTSDYAELLQGEGYMKLNSNQRYSDAFTDDVKEGRPVFGLGDVVKQYRGYYTWQREMEISQDGSLVKDESWELLYKVIMTANITLDQINESSGTEAEKQFVSGEAYFLRAFCYFQLVNLYAKPYDAATAATDPGVPINLNANPENQLFYRESVQKVYDQVEEDLSKALDLFNQANKESTIFHANADACNFLFCRIALYKKEWDDVIAYADKVLANHPNLYDIAKYDFTNKKVVKNFVFYSEENSEIIFNYSTTNVNAYSLYDGKNWRYLAVSDGLMDLYGNNDNRKFAYVTGKASSGPPPPPFGTAKPGPFPPSSSDVAQNKMNSKSGIYHSAFRVAELYLNRAEANAEMTKNEEALKDIKYLRRHRIKGPDFIMPGDVKQLIREERRRELCFESHRWFDLRRWDQPRIEHVFTEYGDKGEEIKIKYVLEQNDPAYTLQIPYHEREFNPGMKINERPDREAIN